MVVHTTVLCLNATTWSLLGKHGQRPSSCYLSWFSASQHSCEWRSTLVFQCPIHVYRVVTIVSFAVTTISNRLDHSYLLVLVKLITLVVGSCFPPCWLWQNSQCLWRGISVFITMPATNWEHPIPWAFFLKQLYCLINPATRCWLTQSQIIKVITSPFLFKMKEKFFNWNQNITSYLTSHYLSFQ